MCDPEPPVMPPVVPIMPPVVPIMPPPVPLVTFVVPVMTPPVPVMPPVGPVMPPVVVRFSTKKASAEGIRRYSGQTILLFHAVLPAGVPAVVWLEYRQPQYRQPPGFMIQTDFYRDNRSMTVTEFAFL